jgi:hypothetical protein
MRAWASMTQSGPILADGEIFAEGWMEAEG